MRAFSFAKGIFQRFPGMVVSAIGLWVLVGAAEAASIFSIAPVVDFLIHTDPGAASPLTRKITSVLAGAGLPVTLLSVLAVFLVFNVLKSVFQLSGRHMLLRMKYAVIRDMLVGGFRDFFNTRWYFFTSNKQGTILNTFTREMVLVGDAFGAITLLCAAVLLLLLYLAIPIYLSWQVSLLSLAAAFLFCVPFLMLGPISYRLGLINTSTANKMGGILQESLASAKLILGYGNQHKNVSALDEAYETHRGATLKSQTLTLAIPIFYYPFGLAVVVIALLGSRKFHLPISESAALIYSLLRIVPTIGQIAEQKTTLDSFFPSFEQITRLRDRAKELKQTSGEKPFGGLEKDIRFEDLSFAYPDHEPVLRGIDVRIPKAKMVAFAGESGAGKSTLIDMLMGFHDPSRGRVLIDGVPLSEYDILSYRGRIGYVPQDAPLFNMSIRDNLLWSKDTATEEDIFQACRQANADFIEDLPKGLDTIAGDRGVRLSGGQVQRIALARAVLRKPALLILDEATSSLDSKSERLIQQAIEELAKETTIVVIAHRLSTIVHADYIYVLKDGAVAEEGAYDELVARGGLFQKMVRLQELETKSGSAPDAAARKEPS